MVGKTGLLKNKYTLYMYMKLHGNRINARKKQLHLIFCYLLCVTEYLEYLTDEDGC